MLQVSGVLYRAVCCSCYEGVLVCWSVLVACLELLHVLDLHARAVQQSSSVFNDPRLNRFCATVISCQQHGDQPHRIYNIYFLNKT